MKGRIGEERGGAEKKMRTQGRRDNPHCFMGIDEGGGKQKKKEIGLVAKNAVYGK